METDLTAYVADFKLLSKPGKACLHMTILY